MDVRNKFSSSITFHFGPCEMTLEGLTLSGERTSRGEIPSDQTYAARSPNPKLIELLATPLISYYNARIYSIIDFW